MSPRDVLFNWRDQNKQCLALTDVHIETSGGIRVTVMPFYMGCRVRGGEGEGRGGEETGRGGEREGRGEGEEGRGEGERGGGWDSTCAKMVQSVACGVNDILCTDCCAVSILCRRSNRLRCTG